jgi:folate-dependent tRNA-U54 methylase TrmFO/GidA
MLGALRRHPWFHSPNPLESMLSPKNLGFFAIAGAGRGSDGYPERSSVSSNVVLIIECRHASAWP